MRLLKGREGLGSKKGRTKTRLAPCDGAACRSWTGHTFCVGVQKARFCDLILACPALPCLCPVVLPVFFFPISGRPNRQMARDGLRLKRRARVGGWCPEKETPGQRTNIRCGERDCAWAFVSSPLLEPQWAVSIITCINIIITVINLVYNCGCWGYDGATKLGSSFVQRPSRPSVKTRTTQGPGQS